ncbi:MAG: hypothetical protein RIC85_01315 [Gammaproteobacteria bacterium]
MSQDVIETLGNLGDFIGGIGVVATVIYLAVQVGHSTASTKAASYQAVVSAISDWSRTIGADPSIARIFRVGVENSEELTDDEYTQFEMLVVSGTRNFENIHYQYLAGGISEAAWEGWSNRILTFFNQPGLRPWWEHHKAAYSSDFREFVDDGIKGMSAGPSIIGRQASPNKSLEPDA